MLQVSDEVAAALAAGRGVVALESSLVAHGFPYPDNLAVGRAMLAAVRAAGAVPAIIAVQDGTIRVGLDEAGLARLAQGGAVKCSSRDLAWAVAGGHDGATTVAATARIAALAGIGIFATGGIGGVHRTEPGASAPADVSADLAELARTPIAVVTAGAKSILDLPATLERLETLGIPVIGFATSDFPAFHSRESGLTLDRRVEDVAGLARLVMAQRRLGLPQAVVICNPPPVEAAMPAAEVAALIAAAMAQAAVEKVRGGALTPFLLAALDRLSGGRTRRVNHALAVSNAELAGRLAQRLASGV